MEVATFVLHATEALVYVYSAWREVNVYVKYEIPTTFTITSF